MRLDAVEALLCNYVFCILCAFVKAANTIKIKSGRYKVTTEQRKNKKSVEKMRWKGRVGDVTSMGSDI